MTVSVRVEKLEKRENAGYLHFLFLQQDFQKAISPRVLKSQIV